MIRRDESMLRIHLWGFHNPNIPKIPRAGTFCRRRQYLVWSLSRCDQLADGCHDTWLVDEKRWILTGYPRLHMVTHGYTWLQLVEPTNWLHVVDLNPRLGNPCSLRRLFGSTNLWPVCRLHQLMVSWLDFAKIGRTPAITGSVFKLCWNFVVLILRGHLVFMVDGS